jgi:hypothetical protein
VTRPRITAQAWRSCPPERRSGGTLVELDVQDHHRRIASGLGAVTSLGLGLTICSTVAWEADMPGVESTDQHGERRSAGADAVGGRQLHVKAAVPTTTIGSMQRTLPGSAPAPINVDLDTVDRTPHSAKSSSATSPAPGSASSDVTAKDVAKQHIYSKISFVKNICRQINPMQMHVHP